MPDMEFLEALRVGLRSDSRTDRNAQRLTSLAGLIPTEWGLKALPEFTYPHSSPTLASLIDWPYPTYHRVGELLLLLDDTGVYTVDEANVANALVGVTVYNPADDLASSIATGGTGWQSAGFAKNCYFATKDQDFIWRIPSNSASGPYVIKANTGFRPGSVAKHRDRLVVGDFYTASSSWFSTNSAQWAELFNVWRENAPDNIIVSEDEAVADNWIFYSQQSGGDYDLPFATMLSCFDLPNGDVYDKFKPIIFTLIEQGEMGMFPIRDCNNVVAMKEHNGDLIVYTDTKVSRLSLGEVSIKGRPGIGYREEVLLKAGIAGRMAVGGNDREHVFVTSQGDVYRLRAGEGLQRLGYSEYISQLTEASIVVAHDELENYYWICDGVAGFCLTRTGLGQCNDIMILSAVRSPGQQALLGTGVVGTPGAAVVETEIFDAQMRQAWEISYVDISTTDTDATGWQLKPKYRLDKSDSMTTKAAETFDMRGRVRTKTPGIDFALRLEAADREAVDLERIFAHGGEGRLSLRDLYDTV